MEQRLAKMRATAAGAGASGAAPLLVVDGARPEDFEEVRHVAQF